ncbi:Xaa-Pro dipeptidase [Glycine soja]|nr:Xaa-Pro dipeptidase [Glycine soja]
MSKTGRSSSLPFVNTCPSLLVLLQDGEEQTRYDTDHLKLFMYPNPEPRHFNLSIPNSICFALRGQESFFAYFFGVIEPGFYAAIDVATGNSILFAPRLPSEYAVWLGVIKPLSYFKNTDSDNYSKPADFQGIDKFDKDLTALHPILTECLSSSQSWKLLLFSMPMILALKLMLSCKRKVILGTWEVMRNTKAGMKEYQLESIFLHHTCMYGGCWHCSYTCICATGDNRLWNMALFDMGAEYHFYGSDITCSLPVNGKFTSDQSLIYSAVLDAHNVVISAMKPGINWVDMHMHD